MIFNTLATIFKDINAIVCYEILVCLILLLILPKKSTNNRLLLAVLILYIITEICMEIMSYYQKVAITVDFVFLKSFVIAISGIISNVIWFLILKNNNIQKKLIPIVIITYLIICLTICYINNFSHFFGYVFSLGGILYLSFYFYDSFDKIKKEEFEYLFNNTFILLSAPVFMIFGISIVFGFLSDDLLNYKICSMQFQVIIGSYVNFISYSMFLYYGYREYKLSKVNSLKHLDS